MESAPIPSNENERLEALLCCNILDTPPEPVYDDIVQLAAALCDTPIALVSLVDSDRQWFKARFGIAEVSTPRSVAFCAHAILSDEALIVPDASADPRFADNPLVLGSPGLRSYAGAPIIAADGHRLGTVCVIDRVAREFTKQQIKNLVALSRQVAGQMELRRQLINHEKARSAIEAIRERLDLVVQASCDGVWELDLSNGRIECSPQTRQLLKLGGNTSLCLEAIRRIVHTDDVSRALRSIAKLIKHNKILDLEIRLHTTAGETRWFQARAMCRAAVGSTPTRIVGSISDIHERKVTQQRLDRLSWLMEESQRQAHVGGWEYDIIRNCLSWTPETFRIHDLDPTGMPPEVADAIAYYEESSRPLIQQAVREAIEHGTAYQLELPLITATGRRIWVATTGKAIQESGKTVRLIGAFQDITARIAAEQDLRRAHDAAAAANRAKSSFLAVMSHEIRTPMHAILGYTELLQESLDSPQQNEYSSIISGAGHALLRLLDDILELSKIEAGKLPLDMTSVDVVSQIQTAVKMVRWQLASKNLQLSIETAPKCDELFAKADPSRLRQVLLNLIGNAIKFTSKGSITILVDGSDGTHVKVAVKDTGIGIPKQQIPKLFQDFFQVDGSSRRQFGGTGLGLAISRRLVEAMGGSIGVESAEQVGSTFWITLPHACRPASAETCVPSATQQHAQSSGLVGKRVLVAEDNMLNARLVTTLFLNQGLQVDLAQDGDEAIALARKNNYDIIFMDCLMPHTDGFDATKAIRGNKIGNGESVPIIALTANAMPEDRQACIDAGMNDLVSKPFTKSTLLGSLQKWLLTSGENPKPGSAE